MTERNMTASDKSNAESVKYGGSPSDLACTGLASLQTAVDDAIDRKRRLGQYWVVWDGEKPVEVHPETATDRPAAE